MLAMTLRQTQIQCTPHMYLTFVAREVHTCMQPLTDCNKKTVHSG